MKTICLTLPDGYEDSEVAILVARDFGREYALSVVDLTAEGTPQIEEVGCGGSLHPLLSDAAKVVRKAIKEGS